MSYKQVSKQDLLCYIREDLSMWSDIEKTGMLAALPIKNKKKTVTDTIMFYLKNSRNPKALVDFANSLYQSACNYVPICNYQNGKYFILND